MTESLLFLLLSCGDYKRDDFLDYKDILWWRRDGVADFPTVEGDS